MVIWPSQNNFPANQPTAKRCTTERAKVAWEQGAAGGHLRDHTACRPEVLRSRWEKDAGSLFLQLFTGDGGYVLPCKVVASKLPLHIHSQLHQGGVLDSWRGLHGATKHERSPNSCVTLCYAMLCHAMLFYAMLSCFVEGHRTCTKASPLPASAGGAPCSHAPSQSLPQSVESQRENKGEATRIAKKNAWKLQKGNWLFSAGIFCSTRAVVVCCCVSSRDNPIRLGRYERISMGPAKA